MKNTKKIVILIDEYDKPLVDQIHDYELFRKNRDILKGFYSILKAMDSYTEFVFLTGVTKFSKVSIFSGLNNLDDLTLTDAASTLYADVNPLTRDSILNELENTLTAKEFDHFFDLLKQFFSKLPYDLHIKQERFYHAIFYFLFTLVGLRTDAEVKTNKGRIDVVMEFSDTIYVVELKLNQSADIALAQIKNNGYCERFQTKNKTVYMMGINFNTQLRNIDDCKIQRFR